MTDTSKQDIKAFNYPLGYLLWKAEREKILREYQHKARMFLFGLKDKTTKPR